MRDQLCSNISGISILQLIPLPKPLWSALPSPTGFLPWAVLTGLLSLQCLFQSHHTSMVATVSFWWQLFPLGKVSILGHCFLLSSSPKVSVFVGHLHLEASWYVKFSMPMNVVFFTPKLISLPDSICFSTATILSELNAVVFSFFHFSPYLASSFVILLPYISWSHPFYHWSSSIFFF